MIEEIILRRTLRPEWLGGNISYHNPVNVSLYCDNGIMDVPLALLGADSRIIREMCDGPEQLKKHITLVGVDIFSLEIYVRLLTSGEIKMPDLNRYSSVLDQ